MSTVFNPVTAKEEVDLAAYSKIAYVNGLVTPLQNQLEETTQALYDLENYVGSATDQAIPDTMCKRDQDAGITFKDIWLNTLINDTTGDVIFNVKKGTNSILVGAAGNATVAPSNCVAIGNDALKSASTASDSIAIGKGTLQSNTSVQRNVAVGSMALNKVLYNDNTAVGANSLLNATTSNGNTAVGATTGGGVTSGSLNTIVGFKAGNPAPALTTGSKNVLIGYEAAVSASNTENGIAIGHQAVAQSNSCTIGDANLTKIIPGTTNAVDLGDTARCFNQMFIRRIFNGDNKETLRHYGTNNIFLAESGNTAVSGTYNIGCGTDALKALTSGTGNVCLGVGAGRSTTVGASNIAFGGNSMFYNVNGQHNICMGNSAGTTISSGSGNICMGQNSNVSAADSTNAVAIGSGAIANSNEIKLGNDNITSVKTSGVITAGGLTTSGDITSNSITTDSLTTTGNIAAAPLYIHLWKTLLTSTELQASTGSTVPIMNWDMATDGGFDGSSSLPTNLIIPASGKYKISFRIFICCFSEVSIEVMVKVGGFKRSQSFRAMQQFQESDWVVEGETILTLNTGDALTLEAIFSGPNIEGYPMEWSSKRDLSNGDPGFFPGSYLTVQRMV